MTDASKFDTYPLLINLDPDNIGKVYLVHADTQDVVMEFTDVEGGASQDISLLAQAYLEAMVRRNVPEPANRYKESVFGLIMDTVKNMGHADIPKAVWQQTSRQYDYMFEDVPVYVNVNTQDGFDMKMTYFIPGYASQTIDLPPEAPVPTPDDLYGRLTINTNEEWVTEGELLHKGLIFSYQTCTTLMSRKSALVISDEQGELLKMDDTQSDGMLTAMLDLNRKLLLRMMVGDLEDLDANAIMKIHAGLHNALCDVMGMFEYVNLSDGMSASVRATLGPVNCLITHTFLEQHNVIEVTYRFFLNNQSWFIDHRETYEFHETIHDVNTIYKSNKNRIHLALGLEPVEETVEEVALDSDAKLSMIVAVGPQSGIGMGNDLLVRIKEDLKYFRETTLEHVVIMGRKTFESIGKPLPHRLNIVITTDPEYLMASAAETEGGDLPANLMVVTSKEEALLLARRLNTKYGDNRDIFVIGGESVYKQFLDETSSVHLTMVDMDDSHADVFFPLTPNSIQADWNIEQLGDQMTADDDITYRRYLLTRKS